MVAGRAVACRGTDGGGGVGVRGGRVATYGDDEGAWRRGGQGWRGIRVDVSTAGDSGARGVGGDDGGRSWWQAGWCLADRPGG